MTSTWPTQDGAITSIVKEDLDLVVRRAVLLGIDKEHWAKLFVDAKTILVDARRFEMIQRVLAGVPPNKRHKCLFNQGFKSYISQGSEERAKDYLPKIV